MKASTIASTDSPVSGPVVPAPLRRASEQGWVMITTLLTLLLITSLGILYFVMVNRDVLIAGHYYRENQAFHASDAGLTIAMDNILTNVLNLTVPAPSVLSTPVNPADANANYSYCLNAGCPNPPTNLSAMTDNPPSRPGTAANINLGAIGFVVESTGTTTDGASTTLESWVRAMVNKKTYYGGTT